MTRVTISAPDGHPGEATVCVDGVPIPGLCRYAVEQRAGEGPPVVVLELYATQLAVNLPDAVLAALDASPDALGEMAVEGSADAPGTRSTTTPYAMMERRAVAGTQLEGVDVATLAEEWTLLAPDSRVEILRAMGVPIETAADEGPMVDAFAVVHEAGKLREFAAAVTIALREDREDAAALGHPNGQWERVTHPGDPAGETASERAAFADREVDA